MTITFGPDPLQQAVQTVLEALEAGSVPHERTLVDLKEEAGRRPGGRLVSGGPENEAAADHLAGAAACMANSPGGGALIVGAADDGALIGAELDAEWLRYRVYQKLDRQLTVSVREVSVRGVRLLVVTSPEAVEPIRWNGKIRWRVSDHCVEIDASTWHSGRRRQMQFDWSAQSSSLPISSVREAAVEVARDFLRESDPELAEVDTPSLLRRLNAATGDGMLTNAAVLAFVGRRSPSLDYLRREIAGEDSTARVRREGRSILEQLAEVFTTARAHNPVRHVGEGLAVSQTRRLPERALREAIVNGIAHREWGLDDPTVVEHFGGTLRVSSPGGFYGGVTERNIITHPSKSRNTALAELLAAIGVAEREGIGVDRMVGDMLRLGYQEPEIRETGGPLVVTTLVSGTVDEAWVAWLARLGDPTLQRDLRLLMSLRWLVARGWIDVPTAAPYLQLPLTETQDVLSTLLRTDREPPLLRAVDGVPQSALYPAYVLSDQAAAMLDAEDRRHHHRRVLPSRERVAMAYANARGRISSTELGSLVGAHAANVGAVLRRLEDSGELEPSRANRRGAGLHYRLPGSGGDWQGV